MGTIPRPPGKALVGNALDLSATAPVADLVAMAKKLGPIYELNIVGRVVTFVSGYDLVDELCDEKRFDKAVSGKLNMLRAVGGDGLFTAFTPEPNWQKAHRILLPNFGDRAMTGYHPMMLDVADQLILKWQRLNPDDEVDVVRDMTALTLDTIGLCGFSYRFNSFYRDEYHPFVTAMSNALETIMGRRGLPMESAFTRAKEKRLAEDIAFMNGLVDRIVRERKAERAAGGGEGHKRDFLDVMLDGVDKQTGERLDDTNIRWQIITFLIAGHETTSGLLSFALYYLLHNPEALKRAYAEVDETLGGDPIVAIDYKRVGALRYVRQILKETLRLRPTAPAFAVRAYADETIGDGYRLRKGAPVVILLPSLHRDERVWSDPERFDPDRFAREAEAALPRNCYKPFGNGQRACIGQQFAMQEATLVLAMLLQRFEFVDHTRYDLSVKESLTVKPHDFRLKLRPRSLVPSRNGHAHAGAETTSAAAPAEVAAGSHGTPLLVLFGSNLGTSEDLARQVAEGGSFAGYSVRVEALDRYAGALPAQGAVVVVAASYNGAPPDNALKFCRWLEDGSATLAGVNYAVFGAGNSNWTSTYQAVPRAIDARLEALGARRVCERGEGDAREDLDAAFQTWRGSLWTSLAGVFGLEAAPVQARSAGPNLVVQVVDGQRLNPLARQHGAQTMRVVANHELQTHSTRSTRHVEIALPPGTTYRCGDHLGVLGRNPESVVTRAIDRFGFDRDSFVHVTSQGATRLFAQPLDATISLRRMLTSYVELQAVATRAQIAVLAGRTECPRTKATLETLASDEATYKTDVRAKRKSVLDLLEEFPACELTFDAYLEMVAVMTPRYYSISSSPLVSPDRCTITVGVVRGEAFSGNGIFEGGCSTHLADRAPGARLNAFVKASQGGFAYPSDPALPIVMIGPGTGLAPFRGFLQERRALRARGEHLGRALLFFGCRNAGEDDLYHDELAAFAAEGLVEVHVAYSRAGTEKRYVQHLLAEQAAAVFDVLDAGGRVYVCGDGSAMEPQVRETLIALRARRSGDAEEARTWFDATAAAQRYVLDVWAGT